MKATSLMLALLTASAQADTLPIRPPLSFGSHADLGYISGVNPVVCTDADGNYSNEFCGLNGYNHVYRPEAESPDGHWVGVALYDLDVDAQLWLWHDGEYLGTSIYGPLLTVMSIDNSGIAQGYAAPCYDRRAGMGGSEFSSDVGCIAEPPFGESVAPGVGNQQVVSETALAAVPEPSSLALLAGLALSIGIVRRKA